MSRKTLGIDISDDRITGVMLEQQGKSLLMRACLSLPLSELPDSVPQLRLLCEQFGWQEGFCAIGLPLSILSVRNFALPFRDRKKLELALPYELEEHLVVPVETLVADYSLSEKTDTGSLVVAFAAEKKFVGGLLDGLQGMVDPDVITPAMAPLAAEMIRHKRDFGPFLLLHADLHSVTMVLIHSDRPYFYRRLSYPEEMIHTPPFSSENGRVVAADPEAADQCIRLLCDSIRRSLEYFHHENRAAGLPERVILTGPLAGVAGMSEIFAAALHLPVARPDLLEANKIDCPQEIRTQWQGESFDRALSLALIGLGRKAELNFRKNELAKKRTLLTSRKQRNAMAAAAALLLAAIFGYFWNDLRLLQNQDQAVREEMTAIFKQTFPKVAKVRDPYVEMQAALKTMQGPESPAPLFAADKRVLGLLADISARVPEAVTLQVSRLSIDRESVLIKGTTNTFNAVNTLKNALAGSSRYKTVQILSATADKEKKNGSIRFEIQLQLEGI